MVGKTGASPARVRTALVGERPLTHPPRPAVCAPVNSPLLGNAVAIRAAVQGAGAAVSQCLAWHCMVNLKSVSPNCRLDDLRCIARAHSGVGIDMENDRGNAGRRSIVRAVLSLHRLQRCIKSEAACAARPEWTTERDRARQILQAAPRDSSPKATPIQGH